jgi:hypothetical protein
MSAGSGASNLGYSEISPLSNINGQYVNVDSTNYSGSFSSNEIPGLNGLPGLSGSKNNIDAAAGKVPGICLKGGAKKLKRKIKNITKHYKKMRRGSKKMRTLKSKLRKRMVSRKMHNKTMHNRRKTKRRRQRGGYSQFMNNMPMSQTYKLGGIDLSPADSALATPAPFTILPNSTNAIDGYNHFTGKGSESEGH